MKSSECKLELWHTRVNDAVFVYHTVGVREDATNTGTFSMPLYRLLIKPSLYTHTVLDRYQYVGSPPPPPPPSKTLVPAHDCHSGTNCIAKVMTVKMTQNWFGFACCRENIISNNISSSALIRSSRLTALL